MNKHRRAAYLVVSAAFALFGVMTWAEPTLAAPITKSQLAGPWTATIIGTTGCGVTTMYVTFRLSATGTGSATNQMHTAGCGDSTNTNPIVIQSLSSNGVGAAGLSCGVGCGWQLKIQVDKGLNLFSLVDVAPENPGNFIQGVAIRR
jgi:hypothetical protein